MLDEGEGQRGGFGCRLARLVNEEHRHGGQELLRAEGLDEANKEVDATVPRDVIGGVGERAQELLELGEEALAPARIPLHRLDECRDDVAERLVDDAEAVGVVALEDVGAHEGENRHDVVDQLVRDERAELSEQEERLVVGLRVDRRPHKVDDGRHADRVARDAARRLDILDDAGKGAEDQLARVRDVDLPGSRREVDEAGEEVKQAEDETMRWRD